MSVPSGFWLQYSSQKSDGIVDLVDDLETDGYRPGVLFAPIVAPDRLSRVYAQARGKGEAFVEPCGHLIDRESQKTRAARFPWLDSTHGRPSDLAAWTHWMETSIAHQLSDGLLGGSAEPTIVATPSPQLTSSSGTAELYMVIDAATAAASSTAGDTLCWLGVAVDRDYLRNDARLTELADAVVTAGFPGVVFRCFQTELPPITDRRLLNGLRELVEGCAGADIHVFLPNTGWAGWLASAWGATGYSGGLSKGTWYDRLPTPMANVSRRDTIFEPQLLRLVSWAIHEQLAAEDAYAPCTCRSCEAMGGTYDAKEAHLHQIRIAHRWSEELRPLNAIGRRRLIRQRVADAIDFRDELPRALRDRAEAAFLDTWLALL